MKTARRPLWTCPACGHRFVTKNMWHSCGRYTLADHFAKCDPDVRRSFNRLCALARRCGPVTVYAQKTRIVIMARVRFSGAVTRKQWLDANLWLKRRAEHPGISRIEDFGRLGCVHHFRITKPADFDAGFAALMREAYQVGLQRAEPRADRPQH